MAKETSPCKGTRKDGSACRARATVSGFCFAHDPALAVKRSQARRRGGFASSSRSRLARQFPEDLEEVRRAALDAFQRLADGNFEPPRALALASLGNFLLKVHEVGDAEARLRALEAGAEDVTGAGTTDGIAKRL
jgi:hypothetical protein